MVKNRYHIIFVPKNGSAQDTVARCDSLQWAEAFCLWTRNHNPGCYCEIWDDQRDAVVA